MIKMKLVHAMQNAKLNKIPSLMMSPDTLKDFPWLISVNLTMSSCLDNLVSIM